MKLVVETKHHDFVSKMLVVGFQDKSDNSFHQV